MDADGLRPPVGVIQTFADPLYPLLDSRATIYLATEPPIWDSIPIPARRSPKTGRLALTSKQDANLS